MGKLSRRQSQALHSGVSQEDESKLEAETGGPE